MRKLCGTILAAAMLAAGLGCGRRGDEASFATFDARARAGESLTVAYFGCSLMWSANASEPNETGFRGLMSRYLEKRYPKAHFRFVDASVGGKTAVNLSSGKNLCGAFYQPRLVICDPAVLRTLSPELFAEGMAEVIKTGAICDEGLLSRIAYGDNLTGIIADCIRIKGEIVSQDEHDHGLRQLLNLGHTWLSAC